LTIATWILTFFLTYHIAFASGCIGGNHTIPHAVTQAGANSYAYDSNGNMTTRTIIGSRYTLGYNAEGITNAAPS
jgi:YD repeat-containing protein